MREEEIDVAGLSAAATITIDRWGIARQAAGHLGNVGVSHSKLSAASKKGNYHEN